ncbi:hypothetical protein GQ43DRAFT_424788 [Delitschia confertaspora ATCC 74209]|uniref:Uncharacterized protein n=1 Tax=Delitschia confertaspora ATCC 74209 TaxID=1513339 RepID=A0A9P4JDG8_9PLEO|nr:hypothetical protein GQ43DRAFT_424788 [Delitschia confertaspora ATCC 74209]
MDLPIPLPTTTASTPLPPNLRNALYSALLSSSGIPAIQSTLSHELQASGWTSNLRAYITTLLRSGECTTFGEVMERVLAEANLSAADRVMRGETNGSNEVNGHNGDKGEGGIRIPEKAVREGVRAVRRELEKVCEITVEGEDNN